MESQWLQFSPLIILRCFPCSNFVWRRTPLVVHSYARTFWLIRALCWWNVSNTLRRDDLTFSNKCDLNSQKEKTSKRLFHVSFRIFRMFSWIMQNKHLNLVAKTYWIRDAYLFSHCTGFCIDRTQVAVFFFQFSSSWSKSFRTIENNNHTLRCISRWNQRYLISTVSIEYLYSLLCRC